MLNVKSGDDRDTRGKLKPSDLATFERFGIGPDLLAEAQVERVTDHEARELFGIMGPATRDMSGIVFPYFNPTTGQRMTARVRRDNPEFEDGEERNKYIAPYGDSRHLYFPPDAMSKLSNRETAIALVESEKGVLALTAWTRRAQTDVVPVGTGGCWGWRGRIGKVENSRGVRVDEMGPVPDLHFCDGRKVYVLLDANVRTNQQVKKAESALVAELQKRNCEVLICELPEFDGVNGPDDLLAVCGDDSTVTVFDNARSEEERPPEFTDDSLALGFTKRYGDDLRYTSMWGRWSCWDGRRWKRDDTLSVFDLARGICRDAASLCENSRTASRIASAVTVAAVERLARADRQHAAVVEQWDRDPWLLSTPSGIVDLKTGALRDAKREDYTTKITAAGPGGGCPQWHSFLRRVTAGKEELQKYLQRMCGYALTGTTREDAFFFLFGSGANGKSVFLNTISGAMGDYASTAPIETFIASTGEHHPTDLAGLQGARLVTAVETEDGRRWAESKLKGLTGGDRIAARFMRQDYFEFIPQFKLVIAGNHKPGLRTVDEAMRRRFNLIPFTVTIPASERDPELTAKLRSEWGSVLQWAIEGCLAWQREGLNAPEPVRTATEDYLSAEDALGRWFDERCKFVADSWTASGELFADWREWSELNAEYVGSQRRFSQNLQARGFVEQRTRKARGFIGLCLQKYVV